MRDGGGFFLTPTTPPAKAWSPAHCLPAALTIRALELGAFDFVTKPEGGSVQENVLQLRSRMQPILRAFERRKEIRSILSGAAAKPSTAVLPPTSVHETPAPPRTSRRLVAPLVLIGVSTGGPAALAELLPSIPAEFKGNG